MTKSPPVSQDERFHYEIWSGPSEAFCKRNPSISYIENHNADWDYGLAASDYKFAADALIGKQKNDPYLSNWTAPVCHLIRQTLELQLKSLLQMIEWKTKVDTDGLTFSHDLNFLWMSGKKWLDDNGYQILSDTRVTFVDQLVSNLHAIDPAGDLFRFGKSRHHAFERPKTYDRVGYNQDLLFDEFELAYSCICHWTAVIMREIIMNEEGWTEDPHFDADDFPKL